jgi:hypothetical protein
MRGGVRRWLFADQHGPHFLDHDDQLVLLVEALSVLRRRRVTGTMITIDRNIEEEQSR